MYGHGSHHNTLVLNAVRGDVDIDCMMATYIYRSDKTRQKEEKMLACIRL